MWTIRISSGICICCGKLARTVLQTIFNSKEEWWDANDF